MGFSDVSKSIENAEIVFKDPKVVVLAIGRVEAVGRHQALLNVIRNLLQLLRKVTPHSVILACAPLPNPMDGHFAMLELESLAEILHRECKLSEYFEYSRLGTSFYARTKVSSPYVNQQVFMIKHKYMGAYGLTDEGRQLLSTRLLDKFQSAKLLERHGELLSKQTLVEV